MGINVAFITTLTHNVGDDFVRAGLEYILKKRFKSLEFSYIHKHAPITTRYGFEWVRNYRLSKVIDAVLPNMLTRDRIRDADIVIQSGAPVYWCHAQINNHCADSQWFGPLIEKRLMRFDAKKPFLNLAAGSCQPYHFDGSEFSRCDRCAPYIKNLFSFSKVTTLRDMVAHNALRLLGLDAPVIPCSSIFASDEFGIAPCEGEYVALNYMKGGGHYTFGQDIDQMRYENAFRRFYEMLRQHENVIFACHNESEASEARRIAPDARIFISGNYVEYIRFYARAKFGIMNRVHGSFIMASLGKPSFTIGADTRARMVGQIGLESIFVSDATAELLMHKYHALRGSAVDYKDRISEIKRDSLNRYSEAIGDCGFGA